MHHEHHAGCGHREEHHAAIDMQQRLGELCCSGQCSHPQHQSIDFEAIARQAALQAELQTSAADTVTTKSEKKKKRKLRGFTLAGLFSTPLLQKESA